MDINKYVIYTVMIGGYDDILQPAVVDDRFDYILFSNDFKEKTIGIWQIRPIPEVIKNDNKRLSRYPKTHPETMLAEYEASLYIDANIQITNQWTYDRFIELAKEHVHIAGVKLILTGRDCIYDHALDMCICKAEHDYNAVSQLYELNKREFPRHFGLNENNIIFRSHTELMKEVDEEWWWWITNYSFRDQFSYMYCLWHHKAPLTYFLPKGIDHRNCDYFKFVDHNGRKNVVRQKWVKRGVAEEVRRIFFKSTSLLGESFWHHCYRQKDSLKFLNKNITRISFIFLPYTVCRYMGAKCLSVSKSIVKRILRTMKKAINR